MTVCSFAVRILRKQLHVAIAVLRSAAAPAGGGYLLDRWGSPCSEGDRHVAARRREVQDVQRRLAAPCRSVSESTDLLALITEHASGTLAALQELTRLVVGLRHLQWRLS